MTNTYITDSSDRDTMSADDPLAPDAFIRQVCDTLEDIVVRATWGEQALFYNPGHSLPHGVYFCTVKDHDGPNDRASQLDRPNVYRVSLGLPTVRYTALFGDKPPRPARATPAAVKHDPLLMNRLQPHPVYAWMGWACVLNPTAGWLSAQQPLIAEAYEHARAKFEKKARAGTKRAHRQVAARTGS